MSEKQRMFTVRVRREQIADIEVAAESPEQAVELALASAPDQDWSASPEFIPIDVE